MTTRALLFDAWFMVTSPRRGCPLAWQLGGSGSEPSGKPAEDATHVVGVMELRAVNCGLRLGADVELRGEKHGGGRGHEIDPRCSPVAGRERGCDGARGVHTHPREWRERRDVRGNE